MTFLLLIVGLVLLTAGAEMLVRGASALAVAARVPPLIIGLTIVAFGTSAPELVVSVQSAVRGQADVAIGNVIGSNIFNVLFILGASALIIPLLVSQQLIRFDVPVMIGLSVLLLLLGLDGRIGRIDGLLLVAGLVAYTIWTLVNGRRQQAAQDEHRDHADQPQAATTVVRLAWHGGLVVVGLGLLIFGARWFTDSAVEIARNLGVSELVIGLTIIAAGTSLPEVATSILAAIRGERDLAVGNVVGSNIFNILGVMGLSSVFASAGVAVSEAALTLDVPIMIAVAVACLPIFFTGRVISRWEGAVFLGYYAAYTVYLILSATDAAFTRTFGVIMLGFVVPLTVITLGVFLWRSLAAPHTPR